jgi:hypothetical protein
MDADTNGVASAEEAACPIGTAFQAGVTREGESSSIDSRRHNCYQRRALQERTALTERHHEARHQVPVTSLESASAGGAPAGQAGRRTALELALGALPVLLLVLSAALVGYRGYHAGLSKVEELPEGVVPCTAAAMILLAVRLLRSWHPVGKAFGAYYGTGAVQSAAAGMLRPLLLVLLVSTAAGLVLIPRLSGEHGFQAAYYPVVGFQGQPRLQGVDARVGTGRVQRLTRSFPHEQYSVRWSGYLNVEAPGAHRFVLRTSGPALLSVGGVPVLKQLSHEPAPAAAANVELPRGVHEIALAYEHGRGRARASLLWRPPGESRDRELQGPAVFSSRPAAREILRDRVARGWKWTLVLAWLLALPLAGTPLLCSARGLDSAVRRAFFGIFFVAMATLMLEVALTRIFAVLFFSHFTFLIISIALFGFGFAGVVLSIAGKRPAVQGSGLPAALAIGFSLATVAALGLVTEIPVDFGRLGSPTQLSYLVAYFLAISAPFFFSGAAISLLLSRHAGEVGRLYSYDLVGAGVGCFLVLPLLPILTGPGVILAAGLFGLLGAVILSLQVSRVLPFAALALASAGLAALPAAERLFDVQPRVIKRGFNNEASAGLVEYTRWSAVSRIDVADTRPQKTLWIDAGTNQSFLWPSVGDFSKPHPVTSRPMSLPYALRPGGDYMIVGPSGGREVLAALHHAPRSVTGVELDPTITRLVTTDYDDFIGGIFADPRVRLVTDEGRSFIRRSEAVYDVIQQVANATPVAIANGAFNLSESYLLTLEAFQEYWDHLAEDGLLVLHRWGAIRLMALALETMAANGVERPELHMIALQHDSPVNQMFLWKKSPFTDEEIELVLGRLLPWKHEVLYRPGQRGVSSYDALVHAPERAAFYDSMGFELAPPTDDQPFFDRFQSLMDLFRPRQIADRSLFYQARYNVANVTVVVLFGVSVALSLAFILLPLAVFHRRRLRSPGLGRWTLYFVAIGLGFILAEITFIQKFTLFMGYPAYAMTTVLFSMLVFAGVGSRLSTRLPRAARRPIVPILGAIAAGILLEMLVTPALFRELLGLPAWARILISIGLLAPLATLMGMPFPLAIGILDEEAPELVPWAWGVNAYATVVGSVACVMIALSFGFRTVLMSAACVYLLALLALRQPPAREGGPVP